MLSPLNSQIKELLYSNTIDDKIIFVYEKKLNIKKKSRLILKDLSSNEFILEIGEDKGYVVYDKVSNQLIEYSDTCVFDFRFKTLNNYLYLGPTHIYEDNISYFTNIYSNEIYTLKELEEQQTVFDSQLKKVRRRRYTSFTYNDYSSTLSESKFYINNYEFIRDYPFPSNYKGDCGFVAASMLLFYWSKTLNSKFVPAQYLDSDGNLNTKTNTLSRKLVSLNNNTEGSWAATVKNTLEKYGKEIGINTNPNWYLFDFNLRSEIENNRPVLIFGSLPSNPKQEKNSVDTKSKTNHAVIAYGYKGNAPLVHYGWSGKTEVALNSGLIVSVATSNPIPKYQTNISIEPKDLNFELRYYNYNRKQEHYVKDIKFTTNRLRTGFVEFEKITLSSRTAGQKEAYLSFDFENPIHKIGFEMSYWSKNEMFLPIDKPQANIYAKDLVTNNKYEVADLFKINLPTDRNRQELYEFNFPKGTKQISIWVRNETLSGVLDRNKGRIAIGKINLQGYKS